MKTKSCSIFSTAPDRMQRVVQNGKLLQKHKKSFKRLHSGLLWSTIITEINRRAGKSLFMINHDKIFHSITNHTGRVSWLFYCSILADKAEFLQENGCALDKAG